MAEMWVPGKHSKAKIVKSRFTLTVPAAATSVSTDTEFVAGEIEKIELDPGAAMATSAVITGYQNSALTTKDKFLDLTFPASEIERVLYPRLDSAVHNTVLTRETGAALTTNAQAKHVVCGTLHFELTAAVAGDAVTVTVYVNIGG